MGKAEVDWLRLIGEFLREDPDTWKKKQSMKEAPTLHVPFEISVFETSQLRV